MTEPKDTGKSEVSTRNIFRITDELVYQIDRTKKLVVIMIIAVIAAIPLSWHISPIFLGSPYNFRLAGIISILIATLFIAVGVRQGLILSKWTSEYKKYKELQKRIDEKLDFESGDQHSAQ